ncbi:MAG: rRNA maturation RNase YbeY [Paracoccaceae bacterium]
MSIECVFDDDWNALDLETLANAAAARVLARIGLSIANCEISLLACNDARIAILNRDFRGKEVPTNVLSWPNENLSASTAGATPRVPQSDADGLIELGDIAIAYETCAKEAENAGITLENHVTHLVVHGTLHLLGYDHVSDQDATLMEGLETEILGSMGLDDPYRDSNGVKGPQFG